MSSSTELVGNITQGRAYKADEYILQGRTRHAIDEMPWLTEADEGIIALALEYSKRIDNALRAADDHPDNANLQVSATKALYLGPHLVNALKALGGTPGDRLELEQKRLAVQPADEKDQEDAVVSFLRDNQVKVAARVRARK